MYFNEDMKLPVSLVQSQGPDNSFYVARAAQPQSALLYSATPLPQRRRRKRLTPYALIETSLNNTKPTHNTVHT